MSIGSAMPGGVWSGDGFVHLHVASGYSLQYGASRPDVLVERAKAWGQPALALTDRDGLYGAVRFVQACTAAGIDPILGVDLAVDAGGASPETAGTQPNRTRTPTKGGALVDLRLPRVTVLARGAGASVAPGRGWARLCRLTTQTHLRGERGTPVTTPQIVARHTRPEHVGAPAHLLILLGPDSDVGRAALARRRDLAHALLRRWQELLPPDALAIEVVCHGGPEGSPASLGHAARMLALARECGVRAVLTAAVRHADPQDAATVDILDAARRLVALDVRHLDRTTTAGYLAPTHAMRAIALDVASASGPGLAGGGALAREAAQALVRETLAVAAECVLHPARDLGIGAVHLPEASILDITPGLTPQAELARRCHDGIGRRYPGRSESQLARVHARLDEELRTIEALGFATYFLTVGIVVDLIREMGVRVAARGSGAGSLVNYLLGISGVDPIRYGLLMERFCTTLRAELPDIDIDVESARRTEIYERVLQRFGGERVTCVSMMDSYRVRHAIRDVGAALGMPPTEVDAMAKAFPHISARNVRDALVDLPELRASGLDSPRLRTVYDLVERLDGLPRHIALHPCGVVLSNAGLLDRTPVEASWLGFPMSQLDKDDVETLGLLKLDILGIRMQSAMAHAVAQVAQVDGVTVDLDDESQVPFDDERTFEMIRTTRTLGCFQIESPGQRELVGKLGPERFEDLVIDISLFRPGPVKSDMIVPFLNARHGWSDPEYLHPDLIPALAETEGVVVFHEQVLMIVAETTGVSLAQADEVRRALGSPTGQEQVEAWWRPAALARGYSLEASDRIWEVLKAFASFGFCKAHAAAFALPTYQSAWLKTHHPAAFLAGVLTHDPGMYPKRLILDDARSLGIEVLPLDVNRSVGEYVVERVDTGSGSAGGEGDPCSRGWAPGPGAESGAQSGLGPVRGMRAARASECVPDGRGYGIRLSLADVKGISGAEVASIVAGAPYASLADFFVRAHVSRPVVERLVLAGAFDELHGIRLAGTRTGSEPGRRGRVTRRDLLLHVAELDRWSRSVSRVSARSSATKSRKAVAAHRRTPAGGRGVDVPVVDPALRDADLPMPLDPAVLAARQSQAAAPVAEHQPTQLTLDLGDTPELVHGSGLPELTGPERVRAELDILGLDASAHVVDFYAPMLAALGVTRSVDLLAARSTSEVLVAGVKVATQTPPIRSGRRVVFLTVDDGTGPADATFFEDAQGPYATTVFHSWMLLVRGVVRRTGSRGLSLRATGAWELSGLWQAWEAGGLDAVVAALEQADTDARMLAEAAEQAAAEAMSGGRRGRRVLVHASGFRQSPYADLKPPGEDVRSAGAARKLSAAGGMGGPEHPGAVLPPRKLWHASPGSSGH